VDSIDHEEGRAPLVDLPVLRRWMDERGLGAGELRDFHPLRGGTQNIVLRFRRRERSFVLRRPPRHSRPESNRTIMREARMLEVLADTDVPHPRLIAASAGEDMLGVAFYLMEAVDGFNPVEGLPALHTRPEAQHQMGLAMVDAIVSLGAIDYRSRGLADFGNPDSYLERQVGRWASLLESYRQYGDWPGPQCLPNRHEIAHWLEANRPRSYEPGIVHGDFHLANVMFRRDAPELAALVDWELTTIGDPLLDLGWLLATWPEDGVSISATLDVQPWLGFPSPIELVERYRAGSARDLAAVGWYATLACYKLGIILEGTYARACAGQADSATGEALHQAATRLFERSTRFMANRRGGLAA
jgi:aminoglycoside phosphotransferase (APT) family kinase protein